MPSYRLSQTVDRSEWISRYPRPSRETVHALTSALLKALGKGVVMTDRDELLSYSYDATGERHWPDVVVIPETVEQVQTAVALAYRHGVPVIGRGASTNLSGGTTPLVGGMVLGFTRLNKILEINYEERWVRVQPGVVNADLSAALKPGGFFYPPDPGSHRVSTIGGNIAENSGGPHCVKYGVTTHHTLALQLVLSDGRLVNLPRIGDTAGGIDAGTLVIGSEGTLGLVTEAVLAIHPLPVAARTALVSFRQVEEAMQSVSAIVKARVRPAALELLDQESIRVVERFAKAGYPLDAGAVLLIELDGSNEDIEAGMRAVRIVCEGQGAISFQVAHTAEEADNLWRGRRAHYGAAARIAPHLWVQDVTVPRPRLGEMMQRILAISDQMNLQIITVAHAGDGNLHPDIPFDPRDNDMVARLKAADRAILTACVDLGGSITGEHGVGIDKAEYLPLMYSPEELEAMNDIKAAFDPAALLNPLKALWPAGDIEVTPAPSDCPERIASLEELQAALRWCSDNDVPVSIEGSGHRSPPSSDLRKVIHTRSFDAVHDFDLDNFSVEVGAGMPAYKLAQLLAAENVTVPGIEPFMEDTVGGLIAANAPYWRYSGGHGWRDFVLAIEWVDMRGRVLRFGRKTMKNVAGYDMAKLLVGSQGKLGVITRVTLRLLPKPDQLTVAVTDLLPVDEALAAAQRVLSHSGGPDGLLLVRDAHADRVALWCAGSSATEDARRQLQHDIGIALTFADGEDVWTQWESRRISGVYAAVQEHRYAAGRIPVMGADLHQLFDRTADAIYFCPENGWYEMIGGNGGHPWSDAPNEDVNSLRERVARVFDPKQLLL